MRRGFSFFFVVLVALMGAFITAGCTGSSVAPSPPSDSSPVPSLPESSVTVQSTYPEGDGTTLSYGDFVLANVSWGISQTDWARATAAGQDPGAYICFGIEPGHIMRSCSGKGLGSPVGQMSLAGTIPSGHPTFGTVSQTRYIVIIVTEGPLSFPQNGGDRALSLNTPLSTMLVPPFAVKTVERVVNWKPRN